MRKSELREEIMEGCPESFRDDLSSSIDKLEGIIGDILGELSIDDISDVGRIEEAHRLTDDLCDALY